MKRLAVFDLDGTITRHDTLIQFILGYLKSRPWRLFGFLLSVPAVLLYVLRLSDRGQLKGSVMHWTLGGYDLVASLYTADNADAAALGRILYTAHRWLHAYGTLQLVVFGDAVPDWLLLEVLLDWKPMRHSQRELQDIVARSPFNQSNADVAATPSGLNLFLRATK